jgi:hypothetical protein
LKAIVPAALVLLTIMPVAAQEAQPAQANARSGAAVPLKVSLVFSRYQGDKKISSVPYTLWVTANESRTSLRMGTLIRVASTTFVKEG